jgi:hypothetical protein
VVSLAAGSAVPHAGSLTTKGLPVRYSMVNAAALGFDLVRLPGGARTAEILLAACAAGPADLALLAAHHPGGDRADRWRRACAVVSARRPVLTALELAGPALDLRDLDGSSAGAELITRIALAPLGDVEALDRFVRLEALESTWTGIGGVSVQDEDARLAADVLVDAATGAYSGELLDDEDRRSLAAPLLAARRSSPSTPPAPAPEPVAALLDDLAGWGAAEREALVAAVDVVRSGSDGWAVAMHDAGWAAHLSGRIRTAARAQLHAVVAFRGAGFTAEQAAGGSWNAVSGVVQAVLVADLLGSEELDLLLRPWLLVGGRDPR